MYIASQCPYFRSDTRYLDLTRVFLVTVAIEIRVMSREFVVTSRERFVWRHVRDTRWGTGSLHVPHCYLCGIILQRTPTRIGTTQSDLYIMFSRMIGWHVWYNRRHVKSWCFLRLAVILPKEGQGPGCGRFGHANWWYLQSIIMFHIS